MNKIKNADRERPIINQCIGDVHTLLTRYWNDIASVRDAKDNLIAITFSFKVDCSAEVPRVKSKMGFSRRYRAELEMDVDMAQTVFPFLEKPEVSEVA